MQVETGKRQVMRVARILLAGVGGFGLFVALSMLDPGPARAQPSEVPPTQGTRLELLGRGEVNRVPEMAVVSAGVITTAADARRAMDENRERMGRMIDALRKAGVATADIQTAQINLSPQYRYADNQPPVITGYQAVNTLTIRFRDLGRAGAILDTLVGEGANQISGPSFDLENPGAAMDEARIAAIKDAKARAALYARAAGLSIKRIVSISEQAQEVSVPMMRARAAEMVTLDTTSLQPGQSKLTVTVLAVFELG